MPALTTIHVWEPSNHPRPKWPISISVPFAKGTVREPRQVIVRGGKGARQAPVQIPAQRRPLAAWPDGSIKWLLLDFPLDLAAREHAEVTVEVASESVGVDARDGVRVEWAGDALSVDTGALQCTLAANSGGLVRDLVAHGVQYTSHAGTVLIRQPNGRNLELGSGAATVELEEPGPERAVIAMRGTHGDADGCCIDYVLRLTVYAWQPILRWHYTMINREDGPSVPLGNVQMIQPIDLVSSQTWAFVGIDREKYTMPEGWISMTTDRLETRATDGRRRSHNLNTIRHEVQMEPFLVVGDRERMVLMLPRWCHFLFPKAAHYYGKALRYDIWPESAGVWEFRRGMAKTHELVLAFAPPVPDYQGAMPAVAPVLRPVIPALPPEYVESTGALPGFFAWRPERYPALETRIAQAFHNRARAYGMLHFGDSPGQAYTAQGRGRKSATEEALIWVNNEYDMPSMAAHQFLRTGDRNVWLRDVEPTVWHMMDVDTMHHNPERPIDVGGQVIHLANHVGPPGYGVDPSHEWVEGLILYHLLTGLEHPREHALAMGEHLVTWTQAHLADLASDNTAARVSGWALIALAALYEFTGDRRYLDAAAAHGDGLQQRMEGTTGHLTEAVSYGFPYRAGFMTNLAVVGLKRLHDISGDDRWRDLALHMIDDQIAHLTLPTGAQVYKELPENRFPYMGVTTLEVMACAWEWTHDRKYLEHGALLLRLAAPHERPPECSATFLEESPEGALYEMYRFFPRDSHYLSWLRATWPFLRLLHDLDLLKQFEPPRIDLSGVGKPK